MRITELLQKSSIALQVNVNSKEEAIDYLVDLISQSGIIPDKEEYKQGILLRESLGTTAIGDEIAIPHAQLDSVKAPGIAAITVKNGVDYDAPDGQDVKLCFIRRRKNFCRLLMRQNHREIWLICSQRKRKTTEYSQ